MGSTNHKLSSWVDVIFDIAAKQSLDVRRQLRLYARNQQIHQIIVNLLQHRIILIEIIVLGRNYNGINVQRLVII